MRLVIWDYLIIDLLCFVIANLVMKKFSYNIYQIHPAILGTKVGVSNGKL